MGFSINNHPFGVPHLWKPPYIIGSTEFSVGWKDRQDFPHAILLGQIPDVLGIPDKNVAQTPIFLPQTTFFFGQKLVSSCGITSFARYPLVQWVNQQ